MCTECVHNMYIMCTECVQYVYRNVYRICTECVQKWNLLLLNG